MAGKKTSAVDPARSLGLLWRAAAAPGRSGLTVDAIVGAAIEIADAEGLDAVSMRRVADRLGAGTMSLYTHVPGKTDLTELMIDAALADLYPDVDAPTRDAPDWRGALTFVAHRNWDLYQRHPWLLEVGGARPVLGPHTTLKYETELHALDGVGISDVEIDSVLTLVLTHVSATARALAAVTRTREESGMTDTEWWTATAPLLATLIDGAKFPLAARVGEASSVYYDAASDPVHAMTFGLDCILDGVAALIARRTE